MGMLNWAKGKLMWFFGWGPLPMPTVEPEHEKVTPVPPSVPPEARAMLCQPPRRKTIMEEPPLTGSLRDRLNKPRSQGGLR